MHWTSHIIAADQQRRRRTVRVYTATGCYMGTQPAVYTVQVGMTAVKLCLFDPQFGWLKHFHLSQFQFHMLVKSRSFPQWNPQCSNVFFSISLNLHFSVVGQFPWSKHVKTHRPFVVFFSLSAGVDSDASPEMVSDSDAEPVEAENPCARFCGWWIEIHISAAKTDFLPWFYHTYINSIHIYI